MTKIKAKQIHQFRPALSQMVYFFFIFGALSLFTGVTFSNNVGSATEFLSENLWAGVLMAGLITYFLVSMFWFVIERIFRYGIDITPEGIWVHHNGRRFYTWDTMEEFSLNKKVFKASLWGIRASKAKIVERSQISRFLPGNWTDNTLIPLDFIAGMPPSPPQTESEWQAFQDSEAGKLLYQFAPHLFDSKKSKSS